MHERERERERAREREIVALDHGRIYRIYVNSNR